METVEDTLFCDEFHCRILTEVKEPEAIVNANWFIALNIFEQS